MGTKRDRTGTKQRGITFQPGQNSVAEHLRTGTRKTWRCIRSSVAYQSYYRGATHSCPGWLGAPLTRRRVSVVVELARLARKLPRERARLALHYVGVRRATKKGTVLYRAATRC